MERNRSSLGGKVRAHVGSVMLFPSVKGLQLSICVIGHFPLNLQMCVFGRKLKPHVPDSFTFNSSQRCFVMILWCSKSIVVLFNGLFFFLSPLESASSLLPGSKATSVPNRLLSSLKCKTQDFETPLQCLASCVGLSLGRRPMSGRRKAKWEFL